MAQQLKRGANNRRPPRFVGPAVGALVLVLAIAYFARPMLHPFAMFFYVAPLAWLPSLLVLLIGGAIVLRSARGRLHGDRSLRDPDGGRVWVVGEQGMQRIDPVALLRSAGGLVFVGAFAVVLFLVGSVLTGPLSASSLYQNTRYLRTPNLPQNGVVRLVPKEVAERIAGSGFNSSTEHLTNFHLVRSRTGKLTWTALRTPDGAVRAWTQNTTGLLALDATSTTRDVKQVNGLFEAAPGMYFFDNLTWKLLKKDLFVELDDPIAAVDSKGGPIIIVPYIKYKGGLIRRPVFGGVYVVHPDGQIEDLSPEQAWTRPELVRSGRVYPENLARRKQDAYAYKNGLWNKWFLHKDQTQITNTETNPQPYLLDFKRGGMKFVSTAEPYGRAFAVNTVFLTNSVTGTTQLWQPRANVGLIGNRRVLETVRSLSIPGIVFADANSSSRQGGDFRVVEPRPVVIDRRLMFMASIIPDNSNAVSKTVFVDAARGKVAAIFANDNDPQADEKILAFINGKAGSTNGSTPPTTAKTGAPVESVPTSDTEIKRQIDDLLRRQREILRDTEQLRRSVP